MKLIFMVTYFLNYRITFYPPHPITPLLLPHLTLNSKHPSPSWKESWVSENRIFSFFTAGSFIEQIVLPVDNYFSVRWPQIVKIELNHLTKTSAIIWCNTVTNIAIAGRLLTLNIQYLVTWCNVCICFK